MRTKHITIFILLLIATLAAFSLPGFSQSVPIKFKQLPHATGAGRYVASDANGIGVWAVDNMLRWTDTLVSPGIASKYDVYGPKQGRFVSVGANGTDSAYILTYQQSNAPAARMRYQSTPSISSYYSDISASRARVTLSTRGGASFLNTFQLDSANGATYFNGVPNGGIKYIDDYSSTYTDRSLVDRGYVTTQLAAQWPRAGTFTSSDANETATIETYDMFGLTKRALLKNYTNIAGGGWWNTELVVGGPFGGSYWESTNNEPRSSRINLMPGSVNFSHNNPNNTNASFNIDENGANYTSNIPGGIEYADNYAGGFTARSLVDKGYVDSLNTATNPATPTLQQVVTAGNTVTGNSIVVGNTTNGSLIQPTQIRTPYFILGDNTNKSELYSDATGVQVIEFPNASGTVALTSQIPAAPDGSETKVTGAGINAVTGTGTVANPYVVTGTEVDGSTTNEIQDIASVLDAGNAAGTRSIVFTGNVNSINHTSGANQLLVGQGITGGYFSTATASHNTLIRPSFVSTGEMYIYGATGPNSHTGGFTTPALTNSRTYTMQDASGTVAFLSDIPAVTTPDGSETKVQAGTGVTVTGTGTTPNPYIVNSTATTPNLTQVLTTGNAHTLTSIVPAFDITTPNTGQTSSLYQSNADGDELTIGQLGGNPWIFMQDITGDKSVQISTTSIRAPYLQLNTNNTSLTGNVRPPSTMTSGRTWTFPDATGTIALTSNILDNSPTNEIQNLSVSGNNLTISGGNTVVLPTAATPSLDQVTTVGNTTANTINVGAISVGNTLYSGGVATFDDEAIFNNGAKLNGITTGTTADQIVTRDAASGYLRGIPGNSYLTAEVDGSVTNEIQNLTQVLTQGNTHNVASYATGTQLNTAQGGFAHINQVPDGTSGVEATTLYQYNSMDELIVGQTSVGTPYISLIDGQTGSNTTLGHDRVTTPRLVVQSPPNLGFYTGSIYPNLLTGNRTYELPNASGTLALLSDIPAATGTPSLQAVTNVGSTTSNAITVGSGAGTTTTINPGEVYAGAYSFDNGNVNGFVTTLQAAAISAPNQIYFPDASGVVALTSQIPTGGGITGGTANYIPKYTGATSLGLSSIYDDGNVGIGTTSPDAKLEISGGYMMLDKDYGFVNNDYTIGGRTHIWGLTSQYQNYGMSYYEGGNDYIGFHPNGFPGSDILSISGGGVVGVNNINPQRSLDVTGTFGVSGTSYLGGTVTLGTLAGVSPGIGKNILVRNTSTNAVEEIAGNSFLTSIPTLDQVTTAGNTTGNNITVNAIDVNNGVNAGAGFVTNGGQYYGDANASMQMEFLGNGSSDQLLKTDAVGNISGTNEEVGAETKLVAGTNTSVSGSGTSGDPYVIDATGGGGGGLSGTLTSGYVPYASSSSNLSNSNVFYNGNLGINTTSPQDPLHVNGPIRTTASSFPSFRSPGNRFTFNEPNSGPPNEQGMVTQFSSGSYGRCTFAITHTGSNTAFMGLNGQEFTIGSQQNTSIIFRRLMDYGGNPILNSGSEMGRFNGGTGFFGINTTSPGSYLGINGNASIGASYATTAAPTNGMIVQGNVGLGLNNPSVAFHVAGATRFNTLAATPNRGIVETDADGDIYRVNYRNGTTAVNGGNGVWAGNVLTFTPPGVDFTFSWVDVGLISEQNANGQPVFITSYDASGSGSSIRIVFNQPPSSQDVRLHWEVR